LLLLDATETYHREVLRRGTGMPEVVRELLPRLRDPEFTRTLLIALPEATPVHEAASLQEDLRRAGIEPFAWVINQALVGTATQDPVLRVRQALEAKMVGEVLEKQAKRAVLVPWRAEAPGAAVRVEAEAPPRRTQVRT
jgi:arsenite-transporting ATPase